MFESNWDRVRPEVAHEIERLFFVNQTNVVGGLAQAGWHNTVFMTEVIVLIGGNCSNLHLEG
jgi:hypothetical protein